MIYKLAITSLQCSSLGLTLYCHEFNLMSNIYKKRKELPTQLSMFFACLAIVVLKCVIDKDLSLSVREGLFIAQVEVYINITTMNNNSF